MRMADIRMYNTLRRRIGGREAYELVGYVKKEIHDAFSEQKRSFMQTFVVKQDKTDLMDNIKQTRHELKHEIQEVRHELKNEIQVVRQELKNEIQVVRQELKNEIQDLRQEMKDEFLQVRQEFKGEIQGLREETKDEFLQVRSEMKDLQSNLTVSIKQVEANMVTKDDKVKLIRSIYIVGLVQFIAIIASILAIIKFLSKN